MASIVVPTPNTTFGTFAEKDFSATFRICSTKFPLWSLAEQNENKFGIFICQIALFGHISYLFSTLRGLNLKLK